MTKETKDILLRLLQQHKELGISEQIDYQKHYLDSLINNSVALSDLSPAPIDSEMVDKQGLKQEMVDKTVFGRETGRYSGLCGRYRRIYYRTDCQPLWL